MGRAYPEASSRLVTSADPTAGPRGPERRIFACVGPMARQVVCVQITRLWRAAGFGGLRIVPGKHSP